MVEEEDLVKMAEIDQGEAVAQGEEGEEASRMDILDEETRHRQSG